MVGRRVQTTIGTVIATILPPKAASLVLLLRRVTLVMPDVASSPTHWTILMAALHALAVTSQESGA